MDNTRKVGGGRKPSKPEYSATKNLVQQMEAAAELYTDRMSLQAIADALALNPIKVRKLLITAGVYESDTAKLVRQTFNTFRETQNYSNAVTSTMAALRLSCSSVTSYLPYEKGVYFPEDAEAENISAGAERQRHYRAVVALKFLKIGYLFPNFSKHYERTSSHEYIQGGYTPCEAGILRGQTSGSEIGKDGQGGNRGRRAIPDRSV